ncbi:exonuclease subunit SbcD [Pontibacter sp. G13]|uniref:metallophosphoesterase family protein n=1 Tax=Pontibacter sp. G13 TaxID=3074898 RepID=UPI00288ADB7F|nr:exonuclease subunit SbcD [Pontibacter sp. G13]WNJ16002.1 exonuclease subunit SbcD [Pontibacter sp. G13]
MKILHTADWHLGKRLDPFSRLPEQRLVLEEICEIAERESVDAILLAGDIFDTVNPSIEALELFYQVSKRLTANGKRALIGIAGNHDSPDRIEAPDPLAKECGIILIGHPLSEIRPFTLESGLAITQSAPGFLELKLPDSETPLRLILTPYANGIRMKRFLGNEDPEAELRAILAQHWQETASAFCDQAGVNILMTHLFVVSKQGERPIEPDDEKPILTVGGAQEIFTENFPDGIQYVALGHLHRRHQVSDSRFPIMYAGSPLSYSMSEAGQQKSVTIIEARPGESVSLREIALTQGKPLVRKTFSQVDDAITWLTDHPECWVELTMVSDDFLSSEDRKRLLGAHEGIVAIIPQIANSDSAIPDAPEIDLSKSMQDLFVDYFQHKHGQAPQDDMLDLFQEILAEDA